MLSLELIVRIESIPQVFLMSKRAPKNRNERHRRNGHPEHGPEKSVSVLRLGIAETLQKPEEDPWVQRQGEMRIRLWHGPARHYLILQWKELIACPISKAGESDQCS